MNAPSQPKLFILGVERSGSTWLSNIFDASADVLFFMEPFAPFNEIFPAFPSRLLYADDSAPFLQAVIREGFEALPTCKHPFLDRPDATPLRRFVTRKVLEGHTRVARALRMRRSLLHTRYEQINLNRMRNEALFYQRKAPSPRRWVIKELRLNFKIHLLSDVFPEARHVVILRNPLSQVHSMMKLLEKGSLYQLRKHLYAILEHAAGHARFEKYADALSGLDRGSLLDRAVAYWFLNYNTLIEDLDACACSTRIVRHEDLSQTPVQAARGLFRFADVPFGPDVEAYLRTSTRAGSSTAGPLDTARHSSSYYLRALSEADEQIGSAFRRAAEPFWTLSPPAVLHYRALLEKEPRGGDAQR